MSDTLEQLRNRVEGNDPVEQERTVAMEKSIKRAMMLKNFGEHPAILDLRATLQQKVADCDNYILAMAGAMPEGREEIFAWALRMREFNTRKISYSWFLRLFEVAELRAEKAVINSDLGGKKRRK